MLLPIKAHHPQPRKSLAIPQLGGCQARSLWKDGQSVRYCLGRRRWITPPPAKAFNTQLQVAVGLSFFEGLTGRPSKSTSYDSLELLHTKTETHQFHKTCPKILISITALRAPQNEKKLMPDMSLALHDLSLDFCKRTLIGYTWEPSCSDNTLGTPSPSSIIMLTLVSSEPGPSGCH